MHQTEKKSLWKEEMSYGWLVGVDPSFALGAPAIILYIVTIDSNFSF